MPLQDAVPVIDDRRYDQLLSEIRTRIARYTPEWTPVWTDVNDSDPGMTLAQLVAWMTELLTYRLGKVPELNYIKFLQLLGIELNAAEPARRRSVSRSAMCSRVPPSLSPSGRKSRPRHPTVALR